MGGIIQWLNENQGWTTTLANLVTIAGVAGIFWTVREISLSLDLSAGFHARFLAASLHTTTEATITTDTALPPGDQSRVLYESYRASSKWDEPYYTGNFSAQSVRDLTPEQAAHYQRHLSTSLRLLDWVLRRAPSQEARDKWKVEIAPHVFAHGRILKSIRWRVCERIFSTPMRDLIRKARKQ